MPRATTSLLTPKTDSTLGPNAIAKPVQNQTDHWSVSLIVGRVMAPPVTRSTSVGDMTEIDLRSAQFQSDAIVSVSVVGAAELFADLGEGSEVLVVGTARRRFFRSGGATVSRTEVLATRIVKRSN